MGDVLKIEGNTWHLTGNPPMSGTVKATGGKVQLVLEKIGDQTREEALKTPGVQDMDKTLKDLDDQLVFEIREVEGKTRLFQAGKSGRFVEWRFELKPRP